MWYTSIVLAFRRIVEIEISLGYVAVFLKKETKRKPNNKITPTTPHCDFGLDEILAHLITLMNIRARI